MKHAPSERFLLIHRLFTFLDEWLFYSLLLYLYVNDYMTIFIPVAILGTIFILISYIKQWYMEGMRFHVEEES